MSNNRNYELIVESVNITTMMHKLRESITEYFLINGLIKEENIKDEVVLHVVSDISNYSAYLAYSAQRTAVDIKAEEHSYLEDMANGLDEFYTEEIPVELIEILVLKENDRIGKTFYNLVYDLSNLFTEVYNFIYLNVKTKSTANDAKIESKNGVISLHIFNNIPNINTYTDIELSGDVSNMPIFRHELDTAFIIYKELTGKDDPITFKKIIEYASHIWNCRAHGDTYDIMPEEIKDYLNLDIQVHLEEILKIVNGLPRLTIKNFYGWIGDTLSIRSIKNVEYS